MFNERSEQAVFELSEKYGELCRKIALNILGDEQDAEECVNEVWLAAWNTIPPQKPDPLRAYICRIARNVALKRYRANTAAKRNSVFDVSFEELEDCIPAHRAEAVFEAEGLPEAIDRFLETLDPVNRAIFMRRYWLSDSITDIAETFGLTKHNVSVRLSRTRSKMRRYLEKEGIRL